MDLRRALLTAALLADGRVLVAEGHEAVGVLGGLLLAAGMQVVGHETKPLVVANIAGGATQPLPVVFDTQIAAYLLNASLRSQTIADVAHERLDVTLPPAGDVPPAVRIGLDRDSRRRHADDVAAAALFSRRSAAR